MTSITLNANVISEIPNPVAGQKIVWDAKLKGFGVRVTKASKSYICERRVKGRTRRVTIGSVGVFTVSEARNEAQKHLGLMATDIDPNQAKAQARAKSITLLEALDAYLIGRDLKPTTIKGNRNLMKANFGDWYCKELRHITPAMIVQRFDRLTAIKSESVANSSMRVFRACWNYSRALTASNEGIYILQECPVRRISDLKKWHKNKRRQKHLTKDQFPSFFKGLHKVRTETTSNRHPNAGIMLSDFAELVLRTGLRKMEAATLKWERVNFANRTFTIAETRTKNGRELTLPMSRQVFAIFERRFEASKDFLYVFPGEGRTGAMVDPSKTLARLREAINDPKLGFHDLRRSFAVLCERLDVSHSKIKRLLNHVDGGDVTLGYLVSTDPERLRDAVQSVSDEIDKLSLIQMGQ